jgi:acetoin utilization deacetylase AcuC-like enzyme
VDCVVSAADLVLQGEQIVYALCRPPGHHAERRVYGGFCYFNNAAIAAHRLAERGRVALMDIDYHHGNGSQDIFYQRDDVFVVSLHGHPNHAYPYFSGFADECGHGAGLGFNRNYPLPEGLGDPQYLEVLEQALRDVRQFKPTWLVISLGVDIMRGDPTGSFLLTTQGMRRIGQAIGGMGVPTLVVQEGGYSLPNLARGPRAFFLGLSRAWF